MSSTTGIWRFSLNARYTLSYLSFSFCFLSVSLLGFVLVCCVEVVLSSFVFSSRLFP